MPKDPKHLVLAIEIPPFYTEDIDLEEDRKLYGDDPPSDSDLILDHCGQPHTVRLRMEVSGEKDSDVMDVLGSVRSASLEDPSPGVTDEWLREQAWKLQPDQDELIEIAVRKLRNEKVPLPEIIDLLKGEIADVKRRMEREAARA